MKLPNLLVAVALMACGSGGKDGEIGAMGTAGTNGTNGTNGNDGADGQLRIFGDGSALAKTVAANATLDDVNTQYTDFTVNAGVTLTVPSGTVIRCNGTFTNNGTIVVQTAAVGGSIFGLLPSQSLGIAVADNGATSRAPGHGDMGDSSAQRFGGSNGSGTALANARHLYMPGFRGGSGGGGSLSAGGSGGGTLVVLSQVGVSNTGVINANGGNGTNTGAGGGGGGIVILASSTAVVNTGTITVIGGNGQNNDTQFGIGGGGGGGIIRLVAPTAQNAGTATLTGGTAGAANGTVSNTGFHAGGGGGGGCGGAGGGGGSVNPNSGANPNAPTAAGTGGVGLLLVDQFNPTAYFF